MSRQASAGASAPIEPIRNPGAIFAVLAAMAMVVLDAGIANVALPSLARALAAAPGRTILVVTAYQAALVMALLPCGALGERFGYRRIFTCGVGLFAVASGLCALAPSLPWLAAARFVQGLGGAAVMALGVALLRSSIPAARFGRAIGWNALTVALASAAAPSIGALVLAVAGWPWLFALNLPLGAAVLVAARALPAGPAAGRTLDGVSLALNAAGFGLLVLGAELIPASPRLGAGLALGGAIGLAALAWREAPKAAPLLPIDLLRLAPFRVSVTASVLCFAGQSASLLALPFYLQHAFRQSTLAAGLYLTVWPVAVAATAAVVGRLADRLSNVALCVAGATCLSTGLALAALWPLQGDPRPLAVFVAVCGLGFGLFQVPNNRSMFFAAPAERAGAAGGLQGTARLTGQTAGAVLVTWLLLGGAVGEAPRIALGLGALLALAAAIVSGSKAFVWPRTARAAA